MLSAEDSFWCVELKESEAYKYTSCMTSWQWHRIEMTIKII